MQFRARRVISVHQKRDRKPLHPVSHQHQEVEVRREKGSLRGRSPSGEDQLTAVQKLLPECQVYTNVRTRL